MIDAGRQQDLAAQIRLAHLEAEFALVGAELVVGRVAEQQVRLAGLQSRLEDLLPQVPRGKRAQRFAIFRAAQRERQIVAHRLHEFVGDADAVVQVQALAIEIARGFADLDELFDLRMVHVEIHRRRTASQRSLRDRERQRVHDAHERNDSRGLAASLDGFADGAHAAPVSADAAAVRRQPHVFGPRVDDAVEIVFDRIQEAGDRQAALRCRHSTGWASRAGTTAATCSRRAAAHARRRRRTRAPRARTDPAWFRRRAGSDPAAWRGRSSSAARRGPDRSSPEWRRAPPWRSPRRASTSSRSGSSGNSSARARASRASFRDCLICHRLSVVRGEAEAARDSAGGRKHRRCCRNTPSDQKLSKCARQVSWLAARSRFLWPSRGSILSGLTRRRIACGLQLRGQLRLLTAFPFHRAFARTDARLDVVFYDREMSTACVRENHEEIFQVAGIRRRCPSSRSWSSRSSTCTSRSNANSRGNTRSPRRSAFPCQPTPQKLKRVTVSRSSPDARTATAPISRQPASDRHSGHRTFRRRPIFRESFRP